MEKKALEYKNDEMNTHNSISHLSTLCWSVTTIFLSFFLLIQLLVMFCFSIGSSVLSGIAPLALFISLAIGDWFFRRNGGHGLQRIAAPAIVLVVLAIALFLAKSFFDMSWDGLWYHQTAVYQMSHGWNPIYDPLHSFSSHLQDWLRFYAKGPWYIALALFETTHNIEMAKAAPWLALVATFSVVFAVSIDFGMSRSKAAIIAALVSLNPVVICQLASYLVDGLLISFLACFIAAMLSWFRHRNVQALMIAMIAAILCINTKLTGLVYICFFIAAGGLYVLIMRRDLLWRYAAIQVTFIVIGTAVFGYNPYVTNTIHRGHPFYPMLGTTAYPSLSQRGYDMIEIFETPHNMTGRNRFVRFAYSIFGHPGPQAFYNGENATLMWPFNIRWEDVSVFRFHEVRISGFGPLFSGALLIGLLLLVIAIVKIGKPSELYILFIATIILSLLVSIHTWWARYGPQFWWLPIVAIIAIFTIPGKDAVHRAAFGLAVILLINVTLVTIGHFMWEIEATRTTYEQMALLRQSGDVEVDFQYFHEPYGERLHNAGVTFHAVRQLQCTNPIELMSVVPGYPGAVRACIQKK
jgi:hypothetical protein